MDLFQKAHPKFRGLVYLFIKAIHFKSKQVYKKSKELHRLIAEALRQIGSAEKTVNIKVVVQMQTSSLEARQYLVLVGKFDNQYE